MLEKPARPAKIEPQALNPTKPAAEGDGVALGMLEGSVGFHLRLAQDASFRAFARLAGQHDMRPGRFAAMLVIRDNPYITQVVLGRAILRDKSTISPILQDLERRGLVERRQSPVDRRRVVLRLTEKGDLILRDLEARAVSHDHALDRILGQRKTDFIELLKQISQAFG